MGIYVKFYHGHSPNMVMSRDPGYKLQNFYFSANFFIFKNVTKFWENWLKNKKGTGKKAKLGWKTPPPLQCLKGKCKL